MFVAATLDAVRTAYPEEFEHAVAAFRKGRSKFRERPLEALEWGYEWCVQLRHFTFAEVVAGNAAKERAVVRAMAIEEKVEDFAQRCSAVLIGRVRIGHIRQQILVSSRVLPTLPTVILDAYREQMLNPSTTQRSSIR